MDVDGFWELIEAARASASESKPFHEVLTDLLAARPEHQILDYQERFDEAHEALYRWDVWAAAYLIGAGCSNDGFKDFRAGLIAQGRDWYRKAADCPDSLADHPAATAELMQWENPLFYEKANYAASYAFQRISGGDGRAFWDAVRARRERDRTPVDMGEDFDFDDEEEMRRRLPRLSAVMRGDTVGLARTGGSIGVVCAIGTLYRHLLRNRPRGRPPRAWFRLSL